MIKPLRNRLRCALVGCPTSERQPRAVRYLPLIGLMLTHALVDGFALYLEPLWPYLQRDLQLTEAGAAALMALWSFTTSGSQVIVGYVLDRHGKGVMLIGGPLLAAVSLSAIGWASSPAALAVIILVGGFGVGAFHPEAAVAVSEVVPEHRTRCLSLFVFGGTLGLAVGPVVCGHMTHAFGPRSLIWTAIPGVLVALGLAVVLGRRRHRAPARARAASLADIFRGRIHYVVLLLVVTTLRVVPAAGMGRALSYYLTSLGYEVQTIGEMIATFLFAGGLGMLLCASLLPKGAERPALLISSLAAIPLILLIPYGPTLLPAWTLPVLLALTGALVSGTTPLLVSYSQQLLPRGTGIASSLSMGVSWGLAGAIVAVLISYSNAAGAPGNAILSYAPFLALSAVAALFLPSPSALEQAVPELTVPPLPQPELQEA